MKILFTICGRAGSKGIKNKNLRDFLGFPLAFYTVSIIDLYMKNNSEHQCSIVLNSDSIELIELFSQKMKVSVDVIIRKPELGGDTVSKVRVIKDSYEIMKNRFDIDYDMIVDLDITSPLRTLTDLELLISKKSICDADVVFSVTDSRRNPYFNMVKRTENGYERVIQSNFNTRQEAPEIFDMNASMYAYSPEFLLSGKGIFDGKCDVIKMIDTAVLDLDHEVDFAYMSEIANYLYINDENYYKIKKNIEGISTILL